jgi:ketosteroid isomerase-like protein
MSVQLPTIIEEYYQAKNRHDTAAMLTCFAEDAVVHDEGEELRGTDAIAGWIEKTTSKYRVTVEPTGMEKQNGETVVTAQVSGNFDGSPIELYYHFVVKNDKIVRLAIRG